MAWHDGVIDRIADALRFIVRAALIANGILIASTSVWIVARVCWHTLGYLDRTLFSHPW